jgi:uncharacterized cupredoxin-like copper-binding protein
LFRDRLLRRGAIAIAVSLFAAALPTVPAGAAGPDITHVNVVLTEYNIDMDLTTGFPGQTLRLLMSNSGEVIHQVRLDFGGDDPLDSDILQPGDTVEWIVTLPQAGTYQILCPVITRGQRHSVLGMISSIDVVDQ